jgi:hypothetical protein
VQRAQVDCDQESPKKIGVDVVDDRIPVDELWQQAEKKDREPISVEGGRHHQYTPQNSTNIFRIL